MCEAADKKTGMWHYDCIAITCSNALFINDVYYSCISVLNKADKITVVLCCFFSFYTEGHRPTTELKLYPWVESHHS